jgi:hypothetical protein
MKLTIGELKRIVREAVIGGSHPSESYGKELMDDPKFVERSVMVPDDIKHSIKKWCRSMGLSGVRKRKRAG